MKLKDSDYIDEVLSVIVFIQDLDRVGFSEQVKGNIIDYHVSLSNKIFDETISQLKNFPNPDKEKLNFANQTAKKQEKTINTFRRRIYGFGLILLCSTYDNYLSDLFENIISKNPEWSTLKSEKEFTNEFKSMKSHKKIEYLKEKLKLDFKDFSKFKKQIQVKYSNYDISTIKEIYMKRHKAAHQLKVSVGTLTELGEHADFFEKSILTLSLQAVDKYNINSQFIERLKITNKQ